MVAVSILALGNMGYALAAREAMLSVLAHSSFELFVTCDSRTRALLPNGARVRFRVLETAPAGGRHAPFVAKFDALDWVLRESDAQMILHLDADAVFTRPVTEAMVAAALGDADLAMAAQTRIIGSPTGPAELRAHYVTHALAYLLPSAPWPTDADFAFFNSGVVLLRRRGLMDVLAFVRETMARVPAHHQLGVHMIADQDYLQVWANAVAPDRCRRLDWSWNHCEHWDTPFPQPGASIVHLSNFCNGPDLAAVMRLQALRTQSTTAQRPAMSTMTFVIVTYNSAATIGTCLAAAQALGHVVVVDNASADETVAICRAAGAMVMGNARNLGFAVAANQGGRAAGTPLICFLNPDCIVTSEVVGEAMDHLNATEEVLLVPDYLDWNGHRVAGRQQGYTRAKIVADMMLTAGHQRAADWLARHARIDDGSWQWPIAACLFVSRAAFTRIGGFDESFFCYMEDVALGQVASGMGIATRSMQTPVLHLGHQSTDVDARVRHGLLDRARLLYARREYGAAFVLCALLARKLVSAGRRLVLVARRLRRLAAS